MVVQNALFLQTVWVAGAGLWPDRMALCCTVLPLTILQLNCSVEFHLAKQYLIALYLETFVPGVNKSRRDHIKNWGDFAERPCEEWVVTKKAKTPIWQRT